MIKLIDYPILFDNHTIGIQTFVVRIYNKNLPDNLKINLDITSAVILSNICTRASLFCSNPFKNASLTSVIVPALCMDLLLTQHMH